MPEANDIRKVHIGVRHDRTRNYTSAARIAISSYRAGVHAVEIVNCIAYRAVIMAIVVSTVEHNCWLFSNIYGRSG